MAPLTAEQIRKENQNRDSSSIPSLNLTLRALSDISFLRDFSSLERLDLSCNNLSSIQGLSLSLNLKWLCIKQNKLESLKGVEGLSKLTVLNAGQNAIKSMDEVRSLTNLRALILNDNNISTVCKLDNLKYLNTLVLSRNPIRNVGKSLENMKSITKLSLSNCQIQEIGNSVMFCVELKEARFANNEITTLPKELGQNVKLQLLDLGKNVISKMSDMKVLSSLPNLKNLNLQGNPVAESHEKEKLAKKVKKLVPHLQIFNAKPLEKFHGSKRNIERDTSFPDHDDSITKNGGNMTLDSLSAYRPKDQPKSAIDHETEKGTKRQRPKSNFMQGGKHLSADISKKKRKENEMMNNITSSAIKIGNSPFDDVNVEARAERKTKRSKKSGGNGIKEFSDGKSSFMDLILSDNISELDSSREMEFKEPNNKNLPSGLVVKPLKKASKKAGVIATGSSALQLLPPETQIGEGGPSAWDD